MKKLSLLGLFLLFSNFAYSQFCGFDVQRNQLMKNPNYIELEKAAEQKIQDVIKNGNFANRSSTTVLTIPVVIHILHKGESLGAGTNISDAQIQSSINHLNNFYRGQAPNSSVDFKIEFILAKRAPDCTVTTGVNRINASSLNGYSEYGVNVRNSNGADYNDIVALSSWPQTDYFNIWVVS